MVASEKEINRDLKSILLYWILFPWLESNRVGIGSQAKLEIDEGKKMEKKGELENMDDGGMGRES